MTARVRGDVVSSFTIMQGALVEETYRLCSVWDFARDNDANLEAVMTADFIGHRSSNWARDIRKVLRRRFDFNGNDRPVAELAQRHCSLLIWKPILLWHMTRDEFLLGDFLKQRLFNLHQSGELYVFAADTIPYLKALGQPGRSGDGWTDYTCKRVASALLKLATDFGFLAGAAKKSFVSYHLPDESFLYILHAIAEHQPNANAIIQSEEWRLFLLDPADVEREILRLHQYRKLHYEVAGSLAQLTLPCDSALAYARKMAA